MASNLTINPQRLWDQIMETAQFGATPKGGIKRLTLSDDDRRVRDWFKNQCEALGCKVTVDAVGNMFALRPGRNNSLVPIAMGLERHRLDNHDLEPFIRPTLRFHLLSPGFQYRQCSGGVSPGPGPAPG